MHAVARDVPSSLALKRPFMKDTESIRGAAPPRAVRGTRLNEPTSLGFPLSPRKAVSFGRRPPRRYTSMEAFPPSQMPKVPVMNRAPCTSLSFILVVASLIIGCGERDNPPAAPPPPAVTVARPIQHEVIEWDEYSGFLAPVEEVEVRSRVSGFIDRADFTEGSLVNQGDLLFVIDPRPFQAALAQAEAGVARAEAQQAYATNVFRRLESARRSDAATQLELEQARQQMKEAEASLAAARAEADLAKLNLEWTRVTAPITGRVGRKEITPGNLINGGPGNATRLTTITSVDPIYAYVDVDEQSVLKYRRLADQGRRVSAAQSRIPVWLGLANEAGFPHRGVVDFLDPQINPETGTRRARGVFPNPDGRLAPGFSARIRVWGSGTYPALLLPEAAIGTDQNQRFVLVVNDQNLVERRNVKLGSRFGTLRAIEEGVQPGDRVIITGLLKARPGAPVTPQEGKIEADLSGFSASGAATQPAATAPAAPATLGVAATAPAPLPTTEATR
jgi:membrane fusion protein, multidrug efflux system